VTAVYVDEKILIKFATFLSAVQNSMLMPGKAYKFFPVLDYQMIEFKIFCSHPYCNRSNTCESNDILEITMDNMEKLF
jgi:hypothetical protein